MNYKEFKKTGCEITIKVSDTVNLISGIVKPCKGFTKEVKGSTILDVMARVEFLLMEELKENLHYNEDDKEIIEWMRAYKRCFEARNKMREEL